MEGVDRDTVSSFFLSSLHFTHSLYKSKVAVRWKYKSRNRQTVERFVRLVNDYAKTEHEIEFYASQLCMTAHYLGMVVKEGDGHYGEGVDRQDAGHPHPAGTALYEQVAEDDRQ